MQGIGEKVKKGEVKAKEPATSGGLDGRWVGRVRWVGGRIGGARKAASERERP